MPQSSNYHSDNIANNSNMEDKYKLDNFLLLTALCPFHLPDYISKIRLNIFFKFYQHFKTRIISFLSTFKVRLVRHIYIHIFERKFKK